MTGREGTAGLVVTFRNRGRHASLNEDWSISPVWAKKILIWTDANAFLRQRRINPISSGTSPGILNARASDR